MQDRPTRLELGVAYAVSVPFGIAALFLVGMALLTVWSSGLSTGFWVPS